MKIWLVSTGFVIAIGAGVAVYGNVVGSLAPEARELDPPAASSSQAETADETDRLDRAVLRALAAAATRAERPTVEPTGGSRSEEGGDIDEREPVQEAGTPTPQELQAETDMARQTVHDFFSEQPARHTRGDEARTEILTLYASSGLPQDSLRSVDCRGTLCRVTLDDPSGLGAGGVFKYLGGGEEPWRGAMTLFSTSDERGDPVVLAYLAEPGTEFPLPEPAS